ncbi:hypothetical protein OG21DRAFT_1186249 [Imleria badia]|nr:hypothetical protein OG21DRAFT_1186249 [Imleria badia]
MSVGAETEKYLRIASLSIAAYDYLITLPAELRFYRSQSNILRPSLGCILFVLIRYVSIIVMVVSNYGVLSSSFTVESCNNYYLVAPFFKVLQTMISQVILGVRTFNIAQRGRGIGISLAIAFVLTTGLEWFTNMYWRVPILGNGSCTPGNDGPYPTAWLYYVVSMLWDTGSLSVSTFYLVRYNSINGRLSRLIRTMIYDGLGNQAVQSAGASMGYAVTWIMSQRILIHLRELSEPTEMARFENIILTRPLQPGRTVVTALRSQCDLQKTPIDLEYSPSPHHDLELDVQVVVEQSVTVDYDQSSRTRLTGA